MSKQAWRSLAIVGQFLFFIVTSAPHTVHHGLHDDGARGCAVATVTTGTHGDLPDVLPLPTPLPLTVALLTSDLTLPEKLAFDAHRSRAPPLTRSV
jgi:hypothetical protein